MSIPNLDGAKCAGKPDLFGSVAPGKHARAKAICAECPVREACLELAMREHNASCWKGSAAIVGTWGGVLFGAAGRHTRFQSQAREHGTDRGYHQHRARKEKQCDPCRAAHAAKWREKYGKKAS